MSTQSDIIPRLEAAIAADDPDLNGRAPEPQSVPGDMQAPAPQGPEPPQPAPEELDFGAEQAQTPVDASAQPPPQTAPNALPRNLSATEIANAALTNRANNEQAYNTAQGAKRQAIIDQNGIQQNINDETGISDNETVNAERDFQKARDVVDGLHMEATNAVDAEMNKNISEERELAQKDPHDFWGNSSTVNKIGALVAMVGAGLAHHDASKAFQDIINNRVAETERKHRIYQQVGHDLRYKGYRSDTRYRTQLSSLQAKRVAAINDIQMRLKQRLNAYANPQAIANTQATLADLDMAAADHHQRGLNDGVHEQLNLHQATLQEHAQAANERHQYAMEKIMRDKANATAGGATAKYYRPVAGLKGMGIAQDSHEDFVKDQALTANVVDGIDEAQKIMDGVGSLDEKAQRLKVAAAFSSGDIRGKLGVGANITGEEGAYMKAFLPTIEDYLAGKIGYGDLKAKFAEAKKLLIRGHLNRFQAGRAEDTEITPQYPLYGRIKEYQDQEKMERGQAQEVGAIEKLDGDNYPKTILDLERAGRDPQHPNPAALQRAEQIRRQSDPTLRERAGDLLTKWKREYL